MVFFFLLDAFFFLQDSDLVLVIFWKKSGDTVDATVFNKTW